MNQPIFRNLKLDYSGSVARTESIFISNWKWKTIFDDLCSRLEGEALSDTKSVVITASRTLDVLIAIIICDKALVRHTWEASNHYSKCIFKLNDKYLEWDWWWVWPQRNEHICMWIKFHNDFTMWIHARHIYHEYTVQFSYYCYLT